MRLVLKLILGILICQPVFSQQDTLQTTVLPIFIINTYGEQIVDEPKIKAHLGIIHREDIGFNSISDSFNVYNGEITIEKRGNGTVGHDKVSYQFETQTSEGENNNVSLLGFPKENDWILYSPFIDKSLIRNVLTYDLAREMGYYASRSQFCELIKNGEYRGIYVLLEKLKRDKNRVDITKFEDEDQAPSEGGFLVKIDSWWSGSRGWKSPSYLVNNQERISRYQYVYPKRTSITLGQKEYIEDFITEFEDKLYYSESPNISEAYLPYIDLNTFVDHFILTELSANPDGYRLSTFLYKDADAVNPLLKMGPHWDYNFAYGNYVYRQDNYSGWEYDNNWWSEESRIPFWWEKFMEDELFVQTLHERWQYWSEDILSCENISAKVDRWQTLINTAQGRNFTKWPILGVDISMDWNNGDSYQAEIDYLKSWTCGRIEWMDKTIDQINPTYNPSTNSFLIYPNPTTEEIIIDFIANNPLKGSLFLYDNLGTLIYHEVINTQYSKYRLNLVDLNLSNGMYILKIIGKNINTSRRVFFMQ